MTILTDLAAFVATASARTLPQLDRDILRRHASDAVVARIAGARTTEGRALAALYPIAHGRAAIAGLAGMVRLTEIDDIHIASCTTPSSVGVPVALALAAESGCDPERLESAIWVGTELVVRLGKAIDGARVLYQGIWPTRVGATLGAAAAASRVWGLPPEVTAHALSLAAMMTAGRTGRFHGELSGRWILFAAAVADGIRAAEAARAGFTAEPGLLEGQWLDRALGVPVDVAKLTGGLGHTSIYPELSLKPYCTSRQALSAAEAMRALVAEGVDPSAITKVLIRVPTAYAGMVSQTFDPAIRSSSYVSAAGLAAIAALAPTGLYDVERASVMGDPRILRLSQLTTVAGDPSMDSMFPQRWPAEIDVETAKGTLTRRITEPLGDPGNRIDDAGQIAKARAVLDHIGERPMADRIMALGRHAFEKQEASAGLAKAFVNGVM